MDDCTLWSCDITLPCKSEHFTSWHRFALRQIYVRVVLCQFLSFWSWTLMFPRAENIWKSWHWSSGLGFYSLFKTLVVFFFLLFFSISFLAYKAYGIKLCEIRFSTFWQLFKFMRIFTVVCITLFARGYKVICMFTVLWLVFLHQLDYFWILGAEDWFSPKCLMIRIEPKAKHDWQVRVKLYDFGRATDLSFPPVIDPTIL